MGTDSRSFPRLDTGLTAAFVGENAQIAEQDRSWSAVNLNAKKAAALSRMSSELGEDETVDLGNDFAEDAAHVMKGVAFLVISIAPARSEAKLSRSRKSVRHHHRQPLPGRARRRSSHAGTNIRAAFSAYDTCNHRPRGTGGPLPSVAFN